MPFGRYVMLLGIRINEGIDFHRACGVSLSSKSVVQGM